MAGRLRSLLGHEAIELLVVLVPFDGVQGVVAQVIIALQLRRLTGPAILRQIDAHPFQSSRRPRRRRQRRRHRRVRKS